MEMEEQKLKFEMILLSSSPITIDIPFVPIDNYNSLFSLNQLLP
jgi:hypothetical protein